VFEIGNSLREARMRRQIDFPQAEASTKIRGKYLRALEDEQFELLPAETYVKGFLRTYAEYLGLDGQLYVDEYNSRFVTGEEYEARRHARRSTARLQRRSRRTETTVVLIALAAIAILTVIVISAWTSSNGNAPTKAQRTTAAKTPKVTPPLLSVTALRGSTHVTARLGSATGTIKFDGTLQKGDDDLAIRGKRLWVTIDSPENVRLEVRGKRVHVPGLRPRVILVTATGWRPA
jgi:cytoskeletal protein RodZ